MGIYDEFLFKSVISVYTLTLIVLVWLFCINIASRLSLKSKEQTIVGESTKQCLCYMRFMHITSLLIIVSSLAKHLKALPNHISCQVVNQVMVICRVLYQVSVLLIWQSRHKIMSTVMLHRHWAVASGMKLFAKLLVLTPLTTLPLLLKADTSRYWSDNSCILWIPNNLICTEMYLTLAVCLSFFILFVAQVRKGYQANIGELKVSFASALSDSKQVSRMKQRARTAGLRNVLVTLSFLVWIIIWYSLLNRETFTPNNSKAEQQLYFLRLVIGCEQLTNNVIQYFVFRDWSAFLFHPCHRSNQRNQRSVVVGNGNCSHRSTFAV